MAQGLDRRVTDVALNAARRRAEFIHMPELRVDAALVPSSHRDPDGMVARVRQQERTTDALVDSGICPKCLARNPIEAPVDFEGWGDRPRRIGPCNSCGQQLFYMTGDSMLIVWNLGD